MWIKAGIIQMLRVNSELRDYLWTESTRSVSAVNYTVFTRLEWRGIVPHGCVAVDASARKFWPGVIAASDSKVRDPYVALSLLTIVRSLQILFVFALCFGMLCCFQGMEILNMCPSLSQKHSYFTHFGAWKRLFARKPSVLIIPLFCCFIIIPAVCKSDEPIS